MDPLHLNFRILGVDVAVHLTVPELRPLIEAHWGSMACPETDADLVYRVSRREPGQEIVIARDGQPFKATADDGQFLYELESDVCIAVQQLRPDLFFVHAAVAEVEGQAVLLVAKSGGGKSTTLWGMLHHGWKYLSDELAPIDIASLRVFAYPRALCLKELPPRGYPLPRNSIATSRTWHIPTSFLPSVSETTSCTVVAVYFVNYCGETTTPRIRPISAAETGARIYANSLNPLAHGNAGLDAAVQIAGRVPGFLLETAGLADTCTILGMRGITSSQ